MTSGTPLSVVTMLCLMIYIPVVLGECSDGTGTEPGYYTTPSGTCEVCPIGWKCPSGTTKKIICAAGTVQPIAKQTTCIECRTNTYSTLPGQSQCTSCPSGWITGVGSTNCSMTCNSSNYKDGTECKQMTVCDLGTQYYQYLVSGNRKCQSVTFCDTAQLSVMPCSKEGVVRQCKFRKNYIAVQHTDTSDVSCKSYTQCENYQYMYSEHLTDHSGIVIRNQTCRDYTTCLAGQYHIVNGRTKEDRDNICDTYTECALGVQYEVIAPDIYHDRVCASLTVCDPISQYIQRRGGPYNDTVCAERTVCSASSFRSRLVTDSASIDINGTDAECQNYTTCTAGHTHTKSSSCV
jgi:hypothetical protein